MLLLYKIEKGTLKAKTIDSQLSACNFRLGEFADGCI